MKTIMLSLALITLAACGKDCNYVHDQEKERRIFLTCINSLPLDAQHDHPISFDELITQCVKIAYWESTDKICKEEPRP